MAEVFLLFQSISHNETEIVLLFETNHAQREQVLMIEAPPALESPSQGDLVGILEISTHRQAAREASDPKAQGFEHAGEVGGGGLPLEVGIGGQDDLGDIAICQAHHQLFDAQVVGADAFDRTDGATQHVVATAKLARLFDGDHIFALFDNTDDGVIAAPIATDAALIFFCDVAADTAKTHPLFYFAKHIDQAAYIDGICLQDMKGNALRAFGADTRKTTKLIDEILNYAFIHTHTLLRTTDKGALFLLELPDNLGT